VPLKRSFTPCPWLICLAKKLKDAEAWVREMVIGHEEVHQCQQLRDGLPRFHARHRFNGWWRARYETEAFIVQIRAYVKRGWTYAVLRQHYAGVVRRKYYAKRNGGEDSWTWFGKPPSREDVLEMIDEFYGDGG